MADCQACLSDRHSQCTGLDGPMTTHPDSLPRCTCAHPKSGAATASPEHCPPSEHVDGKHSWRFDGDDPYTVCHYCGEIRDVITGRVIRPGQESGGSDRG